ncbi:hypothetical protein F0562_033940 [Nyssa sinensis]|uniref:Phytosulfokine n=1 Tax=Nyssa sinensis TaxID=561372 RepID=A0A5J5AJC4_9ASTE|nr:hypothetical protein F0562_033940 [Nyssa sinensis]
MANSFFFYIIALLLLSSHAKARPIPTTTWPDSNPHESPSSSVPSKPSPEEASIEDDGCRDLESEWCLIRRSMVDHTDYIYTQDINGP